MSGTTSELNLKTAVGADDTADYLTLDLASSLTTIDGLFNNTTGHTHSGSHQGGTLGANAFPDNTIPGAKLVDGSVTGAKIGTATITGDKLAAGAIESLFVGTTVTVNTNYNVAAGVMYVFCNAAITVTLPAPATTNRPITVIAISGQSNVNHTPGVGSAVVGGSANLTTGVAQNGVVAQGEAFTYKSDTVNWRAC